MPSPQDPARACAEEIVAAIADTSKRVREVEHVILRYMAPREGAGEDDGHDTKHDGSCEDWCRECGRERASGTDPDSPAAKPQPPARAEEVADAVINDLGERFRLESGCWIEARGDVVRHIAPLVEELERTKSRLLSECDRLAAQVEVFENREPEWNRRIAALEAELVGARNSFSRENRFKVEAQKERDAARAEAEALRYAIRNTIGVANPADMDAMLRAALEMPTQEPAE